MNLIRLSKTEPSPAQPLEQPLARRRCVREYADRPVTLANAACLLWAAQGITDPQGSRTTPSAGALYPMDIYLYVHTEAGHAVQNLLLMAVALNLGAAVVGAFDDERVVSVMDLSGEETTPYLVPVGHPA